VRICEHCGSDLAGKRSNARYCDRRCKTKASDVRRREDGRARSRDRARYDDEAEHRRAYARAYLQENPERMRAIRRTRKARIRFERCLVTERDWRRLVTRYGGRCAYCGTKSQRLEREHIIPLARGGRHSIGNLLPSCPPCNSRKRTKLLIEFLVEGGG
jgi:5-methylcytosine-specific restriction endonuclease McrA